MEEPVAANAGVALNATETQRRTKAIKYFNNKLLGYTFRTFWPHLHTISMATVAMAMAMAMAGRLIANQDVPYLAKQSYLHRYNWLHVHLCEALCLGT